MLLLTHRASCPIYLRYLPVKHHTGLQPKGLWNDRGAKKGAATCRKYIKDSLNTIFRNFRSIKKRKYNNVQKTGKRNFRSPNDVNRLGQ